MTSLGGRIFILIAVPNILGLYLFAPQVKREVNDYIRRVKSGEVAPTLPVEPGR